MAKKYALAQLIRDEWNKTISDEAQGNNGSCVTLLDRTHEPTHEPTHEHPDATQWVQVYHVTRRGKRHYYYRYCYLLDAGNINSLLRVHLPGGNIENPKAIALKEKVVDAIASGLSNEEILRWLTKTQEQ